MYICRVRLNPALLHTGKNSPAPCHLVPACNATAAPLVMQLECAHPRCTCTASPHARLHGKRLRAQLPERWPESAHMCDGQVDGPVCPPDVRVRCACPHVRGQMFVPGVRARCSCPHVRWPDVRTWCSCPVCAARCDFFLSGNHLFFKKYFCLSARCAVLLEKNLALFDFLLLTYAVNRPYFVFDICRQ